MARSRAVALVGLCGVLSLLASADVFGRGRERLVRVRKSAGGGFALLAGNLASGTSNQLQFASFDPLVVGESFEVVSDTGRLGTVTVRSVIPLRGDCERVQMYQGQGEITGTGSVSDARVYAVRVARPLGGARLVRGDAVGEAFTRDTEADLEVALDADGDGHADYARGSIACPGQRGTQCLGLYEHRGGRWRLAQLKPMPLC